MIQNMSVGLADMSNFVQLISAVGTEKTIEFLQDGLRFVGDAVVKHGGQIRKYIGDAILFTFTDPRQAISAAREIAQYQREVDTLTLRYHVAIATGEVLVTQIGHPSYLVEDIIGETVNRAAILLREARVTRGGIALCAETRKYEQDEMTSAKEDAFMDMPYDLDEMESDEEWEVNMEEICECGAVEGQLHRFPCRYEYCPFCGESFFDGWCSCAYRLLGLVSKRNPSDYNYLPKEVLEHGLTAEQEQQWLELCTKAGRIPFISEPNICARCGLLWPDIFTVPDRVWDYYATPKLCGQMLCSDCFRYIRHRIDRYNDRPDWMPTDEEIEECITAWLAGDRTKLRELDPLKFRA